MRNGRTPYRTSRRQQQGGTEVAMSSRRAPNEAVEKSSLHDAGSERSDQAMVILVKEGTYGPPKKGVRLICFLGTKPKKVIPHPTPCQRHHQLLCRSPGRRIQMRLPALPCWDQAPMRLAGHRSAVIDLWQMTLTPLV